MSKRVLIRPYVTEKTTRLMEEGQYTFLVGRQTSKPEIRQAVERHYPGAQIQKVRTAILPGKTRSQFTRAGLIEGRTSAYKKAIVTLDPDGGEIDFFESI